MLGGNDWREWTPRAGRCSPGTAVWIKNYNEHVAELMSEATSKGISVLWVGLPIMGDPGFSADMANLTQYTSRKLRPPRSVFASTWKLFSTPTGAYSESLTVGGSVVQVHATADGVHIDPPAGTALLGRYIVETIDSNWHIHI